MDFYFRNRNLDDVGFSALSEALQRKLRPRVCGVADDGAVLSFGIDSGMPADSFRIWEEGGETCFSANNLCTLFSAVGHFLIKGSFDGRGGFSAPSLPVEHKMRTSVRGMYLASHFYNFYHAAPMAELLPVIEDLAFRGCNVLMLCFGVQHYSSAKTPEAQKMIAKMKEIFRLAARCGIAPALILFSNTGFDGSFEVFAAKTHNPEYYTKDLIAEFNTEICPSLPGGMEEIEAQQRQFFEAFTDVPVKYFLSFAYDEGGCLCDDCYPWVTNGFLRVARLSARLMKEYGYDAQLILSTWHFNFTMPGEWDLFYRAMKDGKCEFAPLVLTAFRDGHLPDCFSEGIPEGIRFFDFPEISMFGARPWGGFGANPTPMRLEDANRCSGSIQDGGFPYSEGIYEDINKWCCLGWYTGLYQNNTDAVRDYIRFEFCTEAPESLLRAVFLMETTLPRTFEPAGEHGSFRCRIYEPVAVHEIYRIIKEAETSLPEFVRQDPKWRYIALRAEIDEALCDCDFVPLRSSRCQEAIAEVMRLSHCENGKDCIRPPLGI